MLGRFDEAVAEGRRALELDPLAIRFHRNQGARFYYARRYEEAVRQYREALELDPNDVAVHEELGEVYEQQGPRDEAVAEWQRALTLSGDEELASILTRAYAGEGFAEAMGSAARMRLERLGERVRRGLYVPAVHFARAYVRLGDEEQALRWLEEACGERNALSLLISSDPFYDGLRAGPRFAAIRKGMNLE